ncbi:hypothetical protein LguiB_035359 [Lonicera macranthoides]
MDLDKKYMILENFFKAKNIQTLKSIFDNFKTLPKFCLPIIRDPIVLQLPRIPNFHKECL